MIFRPGGAEHASLGPASGELVGPAGSVMIHERGMILADGTGISWDAIVRATHHGAALEIELCDGTVKPIAGSEIGMSTLHATIRWIGNALLHRKIAE